MAAIAAPATPRAVAPTLSWRRRIARLAALWLLAAVLMAGRYYWIHWLAASEHDAYVRDGAYLVLSFRGRYLSVLIPLLVGTGLLVLQYRWFKGALRTIAQIGLALLPFAYLVGLASADASGANPVASADLRDGHRFILAVQPMVPEVIYTLFESEGPLGIYWRHTEAGLDYFDDERFIGHARLVLSPDERWLLVARGGIWTDCFRLVGHRLVRVEVQPYADGVAPNYAETLHLRSVRIAALTGLRP